MRVLCVTDDSGQGGTAVNTTRTAMLLARRGFDLWYGVAPDGDPDAAALRAAAGVRDLPIVFDSAHGFERSLFTDGVLAAHLDACRPDLVLFGDSAPNSQLAAKLATLDRGVPYVAVVNLVDGGQAESFTDRAGLVRATLTAADAVVTVSDENLRTLRNLFGLPAVCGGVIHTPCPAAFFQAPDPAVRARIRARYGIPGDAVLCFTVARYEERKGHRHLLRAVAALRGEEIFDRLRFVCAGPDLTGVGRALATEVAQAGLNQSMMLLGPVRDVPDWLAAADVFILPSEAEGMPLVVGEAMARRLPVIATAVGGIAEQLGGEGVVIPDPRARPDDAVASLRDAIRHLAMRPEARRSMGDALYARARALFDEERVADRYADLLVGVAERPHGTVFTTTAPRPVRKPVRLWLDFTDTASVAPFVRNGWGPCEPWGTWTIGPEAAVAADLEAATAGRSLWVVLRCAGYVRPGWPALDVMVEANGTPLVAFRLEGEAEWRTHAWPLPSGTDGSLSLTLRIAQPRAPAVMEGASDVRPLGLRVAWMAVGTAADLPLAAFPAMRRALPARLTDAGAAAFADWAAEGEGSLSAQWGADALTVFLIDQALDGRSSARLEMVLEEGALDRVNAPLDGHRLPNPFSLPFTKLMARVHERREDLKAAFDLRDAGGFARYVAWYFLVGLGEYGLENALSADQRRWLASPPVMPGLGEWADVSGLGLLLWVWHAELRTAFPLDLVEGRRGLTHWLDLAVQRGEVPLARYLALGAPR